VGIVHAIRWEHYRLLLRNVTGNIKFMILAIQVHLANKTKKYRVEEMAEDIVGKKFAIFTSIMYILCLASFVISFISYFNDMIPEIITQINPSAPPFIADPANGRYFWGFMISVSKLPLTEIDIHCHPYFTNQELWKADLYLYRRPHLQHLPHSGHIFCFLDRQSSSA